MADFTPKKVASESGPGIHPKAEGSRDVEHEAPPVMHLEAHHIKKLFGNKMPPIGSKIHVRGLVHVGAYSEDHAGPPSGGKAQAGGEGNTGRTMTLHFHKMEHGADGPGKEADQEAESAKGAKAEMDKALSREAGGKKKGRNAEGEEGNLGGGDSAPRGNNGPRGLA